MNKKKEAYELTVGDKYRNQYITVSNTMIRAREKTTLLESKIEALAMYYMSRDMRKKEKQDADGMKYSVKYVVIPAKEISSLMYNDEKHRGGKTYSDIKGAAISMKQKLFIIEDRDQDQFILKSMYGDVAYSQGFLYVEFEPSMEKFFLNLKQNFSKLKLPILFSFKHNGGFQLYKLLKSYAYPPNLEEIDTSLSQEELPTYSIRYELGKLRMEMGYVDINQPLLREEGSKKNPNWDKIEKIDKAPSYRRWSDYYTRVIEPGVKEINEMPSDIYIKQVIKNTSGRGGKVESLTFVIQHNLAYYLKEQGKKVKNDSVILSDEQKDDFIDELSDIIEEKIKPKDLRSIAEAAGYDMAKIERVYGLAEGKDINNLVGWLIAGLREDYSGNVRKKAKKAEFNDFSQRKYDYEELEKDIAIG